VDVFFCCSWNIIIVDVIYVLDIKTSCCNIGCYKNVNFFFLQEIKSVKSSGLGEAAVDCKCMDALCFEVAVDGVYFVSCSTEDECEPFLVLFEEVHEDGEFFVVLDVVIGLFEEVFCDVNFCFDDDR
jgi:hypothetical protein